MLTVLRRRNFALLWSGQLIATLGNWVFWIALPFYVYEQTGSALATGVLLIVKELPPVLLGSLAGVFVDRWDPKRVVVTSSLLQALILVLLLPGGTGFVYLAILCQSLALLFFHPALGALVPRLVGEGELLAANNLNAFGGNLASLAGPALGALLSGRLGLNGVVFVRCATLLVSAALVSLISSLPGPGTARIGLDNPTDLKAWQTVWTDWLAGLHLVRRDRILGALFAILGMVMFGQGIVNVLWVVFVREMHGKLFPVHDLDAP